MLSLVERFLEEALLFWNQALTVFVSLLRGLVAVLITKKTKKLTFQDVQPTMYEDQELDEHPCRRAH